MKLPLTRVIEKYNAVHDAEKRWRFWHIRRAHLDQGKCLILPDSKMILVDVNADFDTTAAEAVAHLDMGHHQLAGWLTGEQQRLAEGVARMRLDRVEDRSEWGTLVDGQPSGGIHSADL